MKLRAKLRSFGLPGILSIHVLFSHVLSYCNFSSNRYVHVKGDEQESALVGMKTRVKVVTKMMMTMMMMKMTKMTSVKVIATLRRSPALCNVRLRNNMKYDKILYIFVEYCYGRGYDAQAECSLHASRTVSMELKFPVELNSFCDASRVCEPANENLFLVTCRFRKNSELFSYVNNQSIVL